MHPRIYIASLPEKYNSGLVSRKAGNCSFDDTYAQRVFKQPWGRNVDGSVEHIYDTDFRHMAVGWFVGLVVIDTRVS